MHILIELRTRNPGASWDVVGRYRAPAAEIAQLRRILEGRESLLEAIAELHAGIVRDTLDIILREQGHEARVRFCED
jgi:hypothetical protein